MNQEKLLAQWKKKHGDVYLTEINGNEFVYRLLTYKEYIRLEERNIDVIEMDEEIAKLCVLQPVIEDWKEEIYAGYSSSIGQLIREESLITPKEDGTSDLKTMIAEESDKISNRFLLQIPLIIKRSFPEFSLAQIEQMNLKKQIELYSKSVWMLDTFEGIKMQFGEEE